jgi:ABC-type multidrug transport system ATPase subunit
MNVLCGKVLRTSGSLEVQEDVMIRELTVRDILLHAARIRLPRSWTDTEKQEYVNAILETLNLAHVQCIFKLM